MTFDGAMTPLVVVGRSANEKPLALNSVSSPITRRVYNFSLYEFTAHLPRLEMFHGT
jgi:hypothetical protein